MIITRLSQPPDQLGSLLHRPRDDGRRVERRYGEASHVFEEMSGSTVEEEERLVNIDSGAHRIIIKRVYLFDQLDWMRKSALRTVNGLASLQVKRIGMIGKCNDVKFYPEAATDLISDSKLTAIGF